MPISNLSYNGYERTNKISAIKGDITFHFLVIFIF